jgi:hypothetical protein
MANQVLGGYTFVYDPDPLSWSGIHKIKSRADLPTFTSNITYNWGFVEWSPVQLSWSSMTNAMVVALQNLHEATDGGLTYTWNPQLGTSYTVEIVDLQGKQFNSSWWTDVTMTLKIIAEL